MMDETPATLAEAEAEAPGLLGQADRLVKKGGKARGVEQMSAVQLPGKESELGARRTGSQHAAPTLAPLPAVELPPAKRRRGERGGMAEEEEEVEEEAVANSSQRPSKTTQQPTRDAPTTATRPLASSSPRKGGAYYVKVERPEAIETSRSALPIYAEEQPIMEAITANDVVILCGETGSGKTTQLPQFLYEAGYGHPGAEGREGLIGITQPRRVAAVSMAQRVAHELCVSLGSEVAYQIRYDGNVGPSCRVKFMTDGVLLREVATDLMLRKYSVLVIDEAHERGVNTDLLLGLLSRVVKLRRQEADAMMGPKGSKASKSLEAAGVGPLKLVIMSATLQVSTFSENARLFPTPPPVIKVDARQFPVTSHFARVTPDDHLEAAYKKVCKIHGRLPAGGILVFLTGKAEIDDLVARLRRRYSDQSRARRAQRAIARAAQDGGGADAEADEAAAADDDVEAAAAREAQRATAASAAEAVARQEASTRASSRGVGDGWLIGDEAEAAADDAEREKEGEEGAGFGDHTRGGGGDDYGEEEEDDDEDDDDDDEDGGGGPVLVLPLYSMLPAAEQMRVWAPPPEGARLIVVSTNVAETSITIPNMTYVVDCGKVKQRTYAEGSAVSKFELEWISQASADQRAGRAGRVGPGHCYRLYSSSVFQNVFEKFGAPEVRRAPVEGVVLQMKAMGIARVGTFPFPEPPPASALRAAEDSLAALGATAAAGGALPTESAVGGNIPSGADLPATPLGLLLARLPISPRIGKFLLVSRKEGVLQLALPLAAMLAQPDARVMGGDEGDEGKKEGGKRQGSGNADGDEGGSAPRNGPWVCAESDALCLLGDYLTWRSKGGDEAAAHACRLVGKLMKEAQQLSSQLGKLLTELFPDDGDTATAAAAAAIALDPPSASQAVTLRKALCAACPDRIARLATICDTPSERHIITEAAQNGLTAPLLRRAYLAADHASGRLLWLPTRGSPLGRLRPRPGYVAFMEVSADGKRPSLRRATAIDPGWLAESAASLTILSQPQLELAPRYDPAADEALAWCVPTYGKAAWTLPVVARPPPRQPAYLPCALFGRALCSGQVLRPLKALADELEPRARQLTAESATDRAVLTLRSALSRRDVHSRASLAEAWQAEPRFLLRELAALLPEASRVVLIELWPKLLALAERKATHDGPSSNRTTTTSSASSDRRTPGNKGSRKRTR